MKSICLLLILMLCAINAYGKDVTFSWTANPESDNVTEYHLHYKVGGNSAPPYNGTGLNEGGSPITVGNVVEYTVTGVLLDATYHFALTAHSESNYSGYSAIASTYPDPAPIVTNINLD